MAICTLGTIITVFRIGNLATSDLCFLNRQLVSELLTGSREGFCYDKDRCGVIYGRIGVMYVLDQVRVRYSMCNGNRKL